MPSPGRCSTKEQPGKLVAIMTELNSGCFGVSCCAGGVFPVSLDRQKNFGDPSHALVKRLDVGMEGEEIQSWPRCDPRVSGSCWWVQEESILVWKGYQHFMACFAFRGIFSMLGMRTPMPVVWLSFRAPMFFLLLTPRAANAAAPALTSN